MVRVKERGNDLSRGDTWLRFRRECSGSRGGGIPIRVCLVPRLRKFPYLSPLLGPNPTLIGIVGGEASRKHKQSRGKLRLWSEDQIRFPVK